MSATTIADNALSWISLSSIIKSLSLQRIFPPLILQRACSERNHKSKSAHQQPLKGRETTKPARGSNNTSELSDSHTWPRRRSKNRNTASVELDAARGVYATGCQDFRGPPLCESLSAARAMHLAQGSKTGATLLTRLYIVYGVDDGNPAAAAPR